jgi:isopropylmalate/homocitrate/citramalate synthase
MDLITVAMNLYSQGVDPRFDLSDPDRIIEVVEACTGMPVIRATPGSASWSTRPSPAAIRTRSTSP